MEENQLDLESTPKPAEGESLSTVTRRCKKCGAEMEESYTFCTACGARMDGEEVCSECGTVYVGNFCPKCGAAAGNRSATCNRSADIGERKPFSRNGGLCAKVLDYAGFVSGILCALACIIFVFFIGLNASASASSSMFDDLFVNGDNVDLFYFFGKAYEDVESVIVNEDFQEIARFGSLAPMVLGTVVSAVTIAGTATFFVLALISACRKLTRTGGDKFALFTALSFAFYIFGVAAIQSICHIAMDFYMINNPYTGESVAAHADYALNGATVAGIVLASIGLATQEGCKLVKGFKLPRDSKAFVTPVVALAGLILSAVLIALSANAGVTMNLDAGYSSGKIGVSMPFWSSGIVVIGALSSSYIDFSKELYLNVDLSIIFGFVAQASLLLIVALSVTSFALSLNGKVKGVRILSFIALGVSVIMVTFGALSADNARSALELLNVAGSTKLDFGYAVPIAITVIVGLLDMLSIVSIAVGKAEEKAE